MEHRVVARFLDGRVVKGLSSSVALDRPQCLIRTATEGTVPVALTDLKALFFVRDLIGDSTHNDARTILPTDPRAIGAHRLRLTFKDGETLTGVAPSYDEGRPFFFLLPADGKSNNLRVLVNRRALTSVVPLPRS
jgi:hypothetical protein